MAGHARSGGERLTRREDLLRAQRDGLPQRTPPPVRLGVTGSGESLLVLAWSAADLARERARGVRLLGRLGVRPGMRVANTLPGALATPGSLLLGDVVEELGGLDVPLGQVGTETPAREAWELIDRVEPGVLVLDGRSAGPLFAEAPPRARPWWRVIIWLRGAIAEPHAAVPPAAGFSGAERTWLAVPEATSFVASSCAAGRFHLEDGVRAEVIEEATGNAAPAGHVGPLVITPLGGEPPPLRFASALSVRLPSPPCPCGEGGAVMELSDSGR